MKYNPLLWIAFTWRMKKGLIKYWPAQVVGPLIKQAKPIYKELLSKVEGVSDKNPMGSNITMSFIIISIWLASNRKLKMEQMLDVMNIAMDWSILNKFYGKYDLNTKIGLARISSMMRKNADWANAHPEDYRTWDFNFNEELHKDGFYYHFTRCPICDFCKQYGYEEITPALCGIDYATAKLMHAKLIRKETLAEGGSMCDYWMVGNKVEDPQ